MENLPTHILVDILVRLPIKYILRSKSVSKSWMSVLSSSEFTTLYQSTTLSYENNYSDNRFLAFTGKDPEVKGKHCSLYQIDFDDSLITPAVKIQLPSNLESMSYKKVLCSCNGLLLCVCCRGQYGAPNFVLLNPSTCAYQKIPSDEFSYSNFKSGLGYDCKNDDYKIVIVTWEKVSPVSLTTKISIYSSNAGTWRTVPQPKTGFFELLPLDKEWFQPEMGNAALIDNHLLNWLFDFAVLREHYSTHRIACFDICSENWTEVPLPETKGEHNYHWKHLGTLDGKLHLVGVTLDLRVEQIWVMNEYGDKESWVPLYTLDDGIVDWHKLWKEQPVAPIAYSSDKSEIFMNKCLVGVHDHGVWYNFHEKRMRRVEVYDVNGNECFIKQPVVFSIRGLAKLVAHPCNKLAGKRKR